MSLHCMHLRQLTGLCIFIEQGCREGVHWPSCLIIKQWAFFTNTKCPVRGAGELDNQIAGRTWPMLIAHHDLARARAREISAQAIKMGP